MSKTFSRVLWIISGVLLILCGVLCLSRPVVALAAISLFLGLSMLFSGIVDIVIFARGRDRMVGSVWFLVDGILTVLLSLFVLFDQAFTALSLPFIFGMWLLFSGVSKFVNSFDLRRLGVRGWGSEMCIRDSCGPASPAGFSCKLLCKAPGLTCVSPGAFSFMEKPRTSVLRTAPSPPGAGGPGRPCWCRTPGRKPVAPAPAPD